MGNAGILVPENITIETGDTIIWVNQDTFAGEDHSVVAQGGVFSSSLISPAPAGTSQFPCDAAYTFCQQFNSTAEISYQNIALSQTTDGNISVLQSCLLYTSDAADE